jgi:nucleotide-binding universal stress UspA family protein
MAHILLPTDFSESALHAASYAVHLFGRTGNRYTLFHAYADAPVMDPALAMSMPNLIKDADDRLVEFMDRFVRTTGAEGVRRDLLYGPLAPLVADKARTEHVDLVVMGREGHGASFFGSNSVDVIKRSSTPVLVVPSNAPIAVPRTILLADDYKDVRARDLSMLRDIAQRARAGVLVAHYDQEIPEGSAHWSNGIYEQALVGVPHSFMTAHGHGPVDSLERLAEHQQADMIAVLHRHIGVLARLFDPSTSKELALNARYPILVLEHAGS